MLMPIIDLHFCVPLFHKMKLGCYQGHELLEFARNSGVVYLEDEDGNTRRDAAVCCCQLVANSFSISSSQFSSSRSTRISTKRRRLVEEVCLKYIIYILVHQACAVPNVSKMFRFVFFSAILYRIKDMHLVKKKSEN